MTNVDRYMSGQEQTQMIRLRDVVLKALLSEAEHRKEREYDDWVHREQTAMAAAANRWAEAQGMDQRVTVADVARLEVGALGHIDYAAKIALYVARFVLGWQP